MNLMEHLIDQRAEIEAELLFPKVLQEAALCHRVMFICGHTCKGMEIAESGSRIATERCARCGAEGTIEIGKRPGHDAIVMLILPPGRCPESSATLDEPCELCWLAPYTNDAPDGKSDAL